MVIVPGYCESCDRFRLVRWRRWEPDGTAVGICAECADRDDSDHRDETPRA